MDVLYYQFHALEYFGMWKKKSGYGSALKTAFFIVITIMILHIVVTEIILLLYVDVEEPIPSLFLLMCYINALLKMANFFIRYDHLNKLLEKFRSSVCQPQTIAEKNILDKYNNKAAKLHKICMTFSIVCNGIYVVIWPLISLMRGSKIELPIPTYHPYNTSVPLNFWLTYASQGFIEPHAGALHIALDTLNYGFIIIAAGQFELCCHRLQSYINDGSIASLYYKQKWISHHVLAINIIQDIQTIFMGVVVPFFFISLVILGAIIFQMYAESPFSVVFISHFTYYAYVIIQVSLYCWHGNELMLKYNDVSKAVYDSDWALLDPPDRKILLFILQIGQRASPISLKGQCALNIQTFAYIIKTTYAVFNLLKGTAAT